MNWLRGSYRWLVVPLPAVLLGLAYGIFALMPHHTLAARQQVALQTAQAVMTIPSQLAAADTAVAELERVRAGLLAQAAPVNGLPASSTVRLAEQTSQLLARHHLVVMEDGIVTTTTFLPLALSEKGGVSRLRTHRLQGSYLNVLAACEELANSALPVLPVRMAMARNDDGVLEWTVVTWR